MVCIYVCMLYVCMYVCMYDLTKAFDTISRDGALENNGKVWLSTTIHSNGAAVS